MDDRCVILLNHVCVDGSARVRSSQDYETICTRMVVWRQHGTRPEIDDSHHHAMANNCLGYKVSQNDSLPETHE